MLELACVHSAVLSKYSICRPVQTHVSQTCGTVCLFTPRTVI